MGRKADLNTWAGIFVLLVTISAYGAAGNRDFDDERITAGPVPPPEVVRADAIKALAPVPISGEVIDTVPAYFWRHGCGPTSVGMVIGYYDGY
ncbi:MAG: hypothetical protein ACYTEQ_09185, partial [Planctomycetota bacterium]